VAASGEMVPRELLNRYPLTPTVTTPVPTTRPAPAGTTTVPAGTTTAPGASPRVPKLVARVGELFVGAEESPFLLPARG
jgi:hypothetical protein